LGKLVLDEVGVESSELFLVDRARMVLVKVLEIVDGISQRGLLEGGLKALEAIVVVSPPF